MAARDDGEQMSEDVRVQLHDAGDGDGSQRDGGGQDGDCEDVPCSGSEEEENIALLGKSDTRYSDSVKHKEEERKSMDQLNSIEENERNENRQRIVETSEKVARPNKVLQKEQEEQISGGLLCEVLQKEQEEHISGGLLEEHISGGVLPGEQISGGLLVANLISRGVSGLYCLLVIPFSIFPSYLKS